MFQNRVELYDPTLQQIIRAGEDLCYQAKIDFDSRKIRVSTDYGTRVVVYLESEPFGAKPYKDLNHE